MSGVGYDRSNSENLEVLNISNVNAKGEMVLNDEKLMELVQLYPFLYNPRVKPFQDADYNEWAWGNITAAFNKTYENYVLNIPFSVKTLKARWKLLNPIIMRLNKAYDIKSIPETLLQHVIKISVQLENQTTDSRAKPLSYAQQIVQEHIEMVEMLPLPLRRNLESEMMKLILCSELESKATIKGYMVDMKKVQRECDDFFNDIGFSTNHDEEDAVDVCNLSENIENDMPSSTVVYTVTDLPDDYQPAEVKPQRHIVVPPTKFKTVMPLFEHLEKPLLVPLEKPRWVDLNRAHLFIRPCVVRLKRTRIDPLDDIPLSRIKKESIW